MNIKNSNESMSQKSIDLYYQGLKKVNDLFSIPLLFMVTELMMGIIFGFYNTIALLLDKPSQDQDILKVATVMYNFVTFFLFLLYVLVHINHLSQNVSYSVEELVEYLILQENESEEKLKAIRLLERFKGFDCRGYFTLGRSLLTSIVSSFVTYMIVLIQFKLSE